MPEQDVAARADNTLVYPATPDEAPPPSTLPPDLPDFTGRDGPLGTLGGLLRPGGQMVVGIVGQAAGVGKSALAIHAAHRWRARFPDGAIWIDLRARAGTCGALRHVAGLYGYHRQAAQVGDDPQALAGLVRPILRDRSSLLILDNADELPADELAWLLPEVPGPVTLVTGRRTFPSLEHVLPVGAMGEAQAVALLERLVGAESTDTDRETIRALAERLGRLPLALDLAGRCAARARRAYHQGWGLAETARRLEEATDRPAALELPVAGEPERSVALAFALGYDALDRRDQEVFRALSSFAPAGFTSQAVDAVLGRWDMVGIEAALERLRKLSFVRPIAAGRCSLHPLLCSYAQTLSERAGEQQRWGRRYVRFFVVQADWFWRRSHNPETALQAVTATTIERSNFLAAQQTSLTLGLWDETVTLAYRLDELFKRTGHWADRRRALERGIDAARSGGLQRDEAGLAHNLGLLIQGHGDYDEARRLYEEALDVARQLDDHASVAVALHNLGLLAQTQEDYAEARRLHRQAARAFERLGDRVGVARTLHQLGNVAYRQGAYAEARRQYGAALDLAQQLGDRPGVASTASQMGMLAYLQGNVQQALGMVQKSLAIRRKLGDDKGVAENLHQLAVVAEDQGDTVEARRRYTEYLALAQRLGDRASAAQTLHKLGRMAEENGDLVEAERLLAESLTLSEALESPDAEATRRSLERVRRR